MALAGKGRFAVEPNPPVGCVLERDGRVVGEGWHARLWRTARRGGGAPGGWRRGAGRHRLRLARAVQPRAEDGRLHRGPVEAGVARVVFAAADPNMPAEGLEQLRSAGVEVEGPCLEERGRGSPASALPTRPRAQAPVGRTEVGHERWTAVSPPARGRGGRDLGDPLPGRMPTTCALTSTRWRWGWRRSWSTIPRLTCRLEGGVPHGRPQPLRVVFDSSLRTPPTSVLFDDAPRVPVLVICVAADAGRREALGGRGGARCAEVPAADGGVDLDRGPRPCSTSEGVRRLLVEGGARVHGALIQARLADQVHAFVAPIVLGGGDAPVRGAAGRGSGTVSEAPAPRGRAVAPARRRPAAPGLSARRVLTQRTIGRAFVTSLMR